MNIPKPQPALAQWETSMKSGRHALRTGEIDQAQHYFSLAAQQICWLEMDDWRLLETTCWISMCAVKRGDNNEKENLLPKLLVALYKKWCTQSPEMLTMLQSLSDMCDSPRLFDEAAQMMFGLLEYRQPHVAQNKSVEHQWTSAEYGPFMPPITSPEMGATTQ